VRRITAATFEGETAEGIGRLVDDAVPMRVGQLGKLLEAGRRSGAAHALMAGQIAPGNLFDLRPDFKALMVLARLRERNAETLFGAVAAELAGVGLELLPATRFMERHIAGEGHLAGPGPKSRQRQDLAFGHRIAKETSRLDIGQTVVVRHGTVLAVEAFEGTNEAIRRGGALGRNGAVVVKVSKPGQDMRFDVPVVGPKTLEVAAASGISAIGVEAGRTLLLDRDAVAERADALGVSIVAL
jgi:UDP-2,3-diacylglucosamine hydrolase